MPPTASADSILPSSLSIFPASRIPWALASSRCKARPPLCPFIFHLSPNLRSRARGCSPLSPPFLVGGIHETSSPNHSYSLCNCNRVLLRLHWPGHQHLDRRQQPIRLLEHSNEL